MSAGELVNAVVLRGTGGVWRARDASGGEYDVSLRGRLKQSESVKLAVGDEVELERDARDGTWAIAEISPRRSRLARRAPGGAFGERVVAANVDQVVVVFAAAHPTPHLRMLDRFLVVAAANDIPARIVINKTDLVARGVRSRPTRRPAIRCTRRACLTEKAWPRCATRCTAGCRRSRARPAWGSHRCSTRCIRDCRCAWARSASRWTRAAMRRSARRCIPCPMGDT